MIATISCAALLGIDAFTVRLEVDLSRSGMPAFTMVGLAEGAVREAKERVFSALKNCGWKVPPARITVNLPPAEVDVDVLWRERTDFCMDFAEVKGQEHAKRAIEIAAAGGHNLLRL